MARRKSLGSFGPKRKSYGKTFRVNTKGGIPTSVSVGGAGIRVNAGRRGTRTTVRHPITGRSTTLSNSSDRRKTPNAPARQQNVIYVNSPDPKQLPFLIRAVWFLFAGWYLALFWLVIAILFAITIIGLPVAMWMFDRTNAVLTLQIRR